MRVMGGYFVPCFLTQLGKGSNDFYHFEQILCPVLVHAMMVAVFFRCLVMLGMSEKDFPDCTELVEKEVF